jgi:hypothetical protein
MCEEHALKELTIHGKTEEEIDEENDDYEWDINEIDEACCPICNYQEISYGDAASYLLKKYKVSREEVFAKVKEVNKRRKKLYDEEYVKYVFEKEGLNDDSFIETIKATFSTYSAYKHYTEE